MSNLVSKKKHAVIKLCKQILKIDVDIYEHHVDQLKSIIQHHIDNGLSPTDIKKHYDIEYTDFGMFIKKCLNMQIKSVKDGVNNYMLNSGRAITEEKALYWTNCKFKFDPFLETRLLGYDLLLKHGIYHPTKNTAGMHRDHMVSVLYGWDNRISPDIISHPANCCIMSPSDNSRKSSGCSMSYEQLIDRISTWNDYENITFAGMFIPHDQRKHLPKSESHKAKISESNKMLRNYTDGKRNIRQHKDLPVPTGFRRGMTKTCKQVSSNKYTIEKWCPESESNRQAD